MYPLHAHVSAMCKGMWGTMPQFCEFGHFSLLGFQMHAGNVHLRHVHGVDWFPLLVNIHGGTVSVAL